MNYYFNVAVANGINKLGWTPDIPDENLDMRFSPTCHEVITICEEIEKLVEEWPVAHGSYCGNITGWEFGTGEIGPKHTHKAHLAFIEEIKKEPCKHEPFEYESKFVTEGFLPSNPGFYSRSETASAILINPKCKHCGVELVATWSEKK